MNKETLIKVDHITRYYADQCAVDGISFAVGRGEVLGFLGPNGAGKSTVMQIICGVLAASRGSVSVAGLDIVDDPKRAKQTLPRLAANTPQMICMTLAMVICVSPRVIRT